MLGRTFINFLSNCWLSVMIRRTCDLAGWLKSKVTVVGHKFELCFPVLSMSLLQKVWTVRLLDVLYPFQQYFSHDRTTKW